jgi:preprotein translocase subunit YajC
MGTMFLASNGFLAAAAKPKSGSYLPFLIIIVLFGLFYMLILRPQRNRQRQTAATQSTVLPGQRIRTTAGIYGTVVSADDRDVVVQVAPGVDIRMLRRAIMEVVPEDQPDGMQAPPATGPDGTPTGGDAGDRNI